MEKIRIRFIESPGEPLQEVTANWPANDAEAEQLFTKIFADHGEELKFSKRSSWFVDNCGDSVWLLCARKSGAAVAKLERVESPVCTEKNIVIGAGPDKYTYFVCYRRSGHEVNDVVVIDHPVLDVADIRAIERSLVPKGTTWLPTITNITLLAGPQR